MIGSEFRKLGETIISKTAQTGVYEVVDISSMPVEITKNKILAEINVEMKKVVDVWAEKVKKAKDEFLEEFKRPDYKSNLKLIKAEIETASINMDYFLLNYNALEHLLLKIEKYLIDYQMYTSSMPHSHSNVH